LPSGPNSCSRINSLKPMMALSGVRSSWLILARKADLALLAASARSCAASISSSCALRVEMSRETLTMFRTLPVASS
jgi:hypothetical protein